MLALELVAPVLNPVRPRDEHLTSAGGRPLPGGEAVDERSAGELVRAKPAAEGDDGEPLVLAREVDLAGKLGERRAQHAHAPTGGGTAAGTPRRSSRRSPTRSEFAMAVRAGLTAPMLGKTLVSTT